MAPAAIRTPLFGYREEQELEFDESDPDWKQWVQASHHFHLETQTKGIGGLLTRAGYMGLRDVSLNGKTVLEVGPGTLPHHQFWRGLPEKFISVEVDASFHAYAADKCGCNFLAITREREDATINVPSLSVDIILSYYSLEHLVPLGQHVAEFSRVLKPGGRLIGAVPNEGGLAWGTARYLSTRNWIRRHYKIDYDKIIAWEHPNYVDTIRKELANALREDYWGQIPLKGVGGSNLNLISRFAFTKI